MSTFIADDFRHGENFKIGHNVIIETGCVVGDNVEIGHFVLLKAGTIVGSNTFIDSYVKSSGDNSIGSGVTLRFNATIAREVHVEDDVFIAPNVMTIFSEFDGSKSAETRICKGAFVGTAVVISPNVTIGENAVIGAMSMVTSDCAPNSIYKGIPAAKTRDR